MPKQKPKGCCHPDCFNCPLPDCKWSGGLNESTDINTILHGYIFSKDDDRPKKKKEPKGERAINKLNRKKL